MTYLQANQIENEVQRIAAAYPNICETVKLRRSFERQPVTGLVIKNKAVTDIVRPRVLITAGTHAREWAPPDALLTFTDDLLRAYAFRTSFTDPAFVYNRVMTKGTPPIQLPYDKYVVTYDNVKKIVEKLETYIVPMTNPDGRNFSLNYQAFWRKNRNSKQQLQQVITMIGAPIGGNYTLTVTANGATATTAPIAYDAGPADVETALTALPNLAGATVQARDVFPKGPDRGIVVEFSVAADLMTVLSFVTGAAVFVAWYDGVDINRNFEIAFEREVYYAPVGETYTTPAGNVQLVSGSPDYRHSDYRGLHAFSEIETVNVRQIIQEKAIDYYLDLHL